MTTEMQDTRALLAKMEAEEKAAAERNAAAQQNNRQAPAPGAADPTKKPENKKVDSILDL